MQEKSRMRRSAALQVQHDMRAQCNYALARDLSCVYTSQSVAHQDRIPLVNTVVGRVSGSLASPPAPYLTARDNSEMMERSLSQPEKARQSFLSLAGKTPATGN